MIKYALACEDAHGFESWFPDAAAFDRQSRRGLVSCPVCGSTRVAKAIIAPSVVGAAHDKRAVAATTAPVALVDGKRRALNEAIRALQREIEAHTDNVGTKFAETARAIHAGDEPERAIRGQASGAEVEALLEEGVEVMPMPSALDDLN